jgi:hypothetical protein
VKESPAFLDQLRSKKGHEFMNRKEKQVAVRWCDDLRKLVGAAYCLGGASADEIKAATVDFLLNAAARIYDQIPPQTEIPPAR